MRSCHTPLADIRAWLHSNASKLQRQRASGQHMHIEVDQIRHALELVSI